MRILLAGMICVYAPVWAGCATSEPGEAVSHREWQLMCERLDTSRDTPATMKPSAPLETWDATALERTARSASASIVWIETQPNAARLRNGSPVETSQDQATGGARTTDMKQPLRSGGGTGVVLRADGLILTNEHVVREASLIVVTLADGSRHEARRVMTAERLDIAVLIVNCVGLKPLPIADSPAHEGQAVIAVGGKGFDTPIGRRCGAVTNVAASLQNNLDPTRRRHYNRLIESTTALEPGFSGGPLLDAQGRLVGLNVAMTGRPGNPQCRGYAIPLDSDSRQAISDLMTQLRDN